MKCIADLLITEKTIYGKEYFILKCTWDKQLPDMLPGQFANVKIDNNKDVFLRRPFSIHDYDKKTNTLSFLIKIIGKGTETLSHINVGDTLNAVLPLGNSFSFNKKDKSLLIGGGCGTAPLYYLAKKLTEIGANYDVIMGAKCSTDLLCEKEFNELSENVFCTTEDGTKGTKGYVIHHEVFKNITEYKRVFCCGPMPMMKSIAEKLKDNKDIICEVSLENNMACGIGACLCCVTETVEGRKCVCSEGPVFNINQLKW